MYTFGQTAGTSTEDELKLSLNEKLFKEEEEEGRKEKTLDKTMYLFKTEAT